MSHSGEFDLSQVKEENRRRVDELIRQLWYINNHSNESRRLLYRSDEAQMYALAANQRKREAILEELQEFGVIIG